jgi:hypothetical protein
VVASLRRAGVGLSQNLQVQVFSKRLDYPFKSASTVINDDDLEGYIEGLNRKTP